MDPEEKTRFDVLTLTAQRQFIGWDVETGINQTTIWVKVTNGTTALQINMPNDIPLDEFEAKAWLTVKKAKEDFQLTGENTD